MTPLQATILENMQGQPGPAGDGWLRPMDFGGKDGNGYRTVAQRMNRHGWVELYASPGLERATWRYRITPAGLQALANHRACERIRRANP